MTQGSAPGERTLWQRFKSLLSFKILAEALSRGLSLIFFLFLSRYLGATGYGQYAFALSFTLLLSTFVLDFGLNTYLMREIAKNNSELHPLMLHIFVFRAVMSCCLLGLGYFVFPNLGYSYEVTQHLFWALLMMIAMGWIDTLCAFFNVLERLEYEVKLRTAQRLLSFVFCLGILLWKASVLGVLIANAFATMAVAVWGLFILMYLSQWTGSQRLSLSYLLGLLKGSFPLWLTVLFFLIYTRVDIVMLSFLGRAEHEMGWYQAAVKMIDLLNLFPQVIAVGAFPLLTRLYHHNKDIFQQVWNLVFVALFQVAWPLSIGGYFLAHLFVPDILGLAFYPSSQVFQILIWSLFFNFQNFFLFYLLAIVQQEKWGVLSALGGLGVNILLNMYWIPQLGFIGAGYSTVLTEILVWSINFWLLKNTLSLKLPWPLLLKTVGVLGLWTISLLGLMALGCHWALTIGAAIIVYALALYAFKAYQDPKAISRLMQIRLGS